MAILTHECPHCGTDHIGLEVIRGYLEGNYGVFYFSCPRCRMPSCARTFVAGGRLDELLKTGRDIQDYGWRIIDFWPEPLGPSVPENLPEDVERVYLQAERNFPIEGNEEAAGTMYGKALDIGLKKVDPSLSGMLGPRIKKLTSSGKLTSDIAEWSDSIRDIRNDAVHEESPISRDELTDLRNFTEMVLRYLFTLPAAVKQRRAERVGEA